MQTELTPEQIALMSEVIAKYMYPSKGNMYNVTKGAWISSNHINFLDWNKLHEVWNKVRGELPITNNEIGIAAGSILYGNKIEAFEALYEAIQYINQLKKENEKSI